jgi:DNA polymerase-3 subunit delta'|tara:strand:+ start:52 stop:993 length:942 start_codon:yes stop_codon:yes gene_type:complete
MKTSNILNLSVSEKLISLDRYFEEMIDLFNTKKFPKVLLLNGKKGIGKFTLVIHFLNYIYTQNEKNKYDIKNKKIDINSSFHKKLLNQTNQDVFLIKAEENKNIKIDEIRNLKSSLSRTSLSKNSRFTIIDEVEFVNENSVNALLKILEEPSGNNFFILINNQQANLIKTISSRCLISNVFLNIIEINKVIDYLIEAKNINDLLDFNEGLTPGFFVRFNEIFLSCSLDKNDNIFININKLLKEYKKNKDKTLINLTLFLIDQFFFDLAKKNKNNLDFLLNTKLSINKNINDFIYYNLNINSVLNSIEIKLNNV